MEYHQPSYPHHAQKLSLSTQSKLIDSFQYYQVPEFYQNVFINHLKNQQAMVAELCMREEIQALSNNSSYIQSYMQFCRQKQKCEGYVRQMKSYKKKSYEQQNAKLVKTCELVGYLRDINYKCAYFLLKIREKYEQNVEINRSNEKYYYNEFAMKLDSFRKELLKTQLGKYIEFQPQYDPFLINLKFKQYHHDRRCNEALQLLMEFAVQDSYKYLKMGKLLMDWIFMHTRKRVQDKTLERIDLPDLIQSQQYVEYDKLKEEMLRDKLRDKVDSPSEKIRRDRGILDIYNEEAGYSGHRNRANGSDNQIVSLQKYEKQRLRKEGQKQRRSYIDDNLSKLLHKNKITQGKPINNQIRTKSESTSYDPEYSMIGKIRRFKISRSRDIQNSPHTTQDGKRSETLPILPREKRYNDYYRNADTRAMISPKDEYDRKYDYREERLRNLSREKIKLKQINAYQITIGKPNETEPTVRREPKRNEPSSQPINKEKTLERTTAKQPQSNRYEYNRKQNDPDKNQSLKKKIVAQKNSINTSVVSKPSYQTRKIQDLKTTQEQKPIIKKEPEKAIQKTTQSESIKSGTTKNQAQQVKPPPKKIQAKPNGEEQKKQERRQIKMRIGKYTLQNFRQYFDKYQIHKDYLKLFDKEKISKELQFQQSYIIQFLINDEPGALAIIYLIAHNKLVLRLWALDNQQEATLSYPLLKKMLEYVQKSTTNKIIYYKGGQFAELIKGGFVKKKEELYERQRTTDPKELDLQFEQCLSVKCSHIKFVQKQKEDILVSAEIQNFTLQNSKMANSLLSLNEGELPQKLKKLITIKHKIDGFKSLNKLLQKQDFDSYQASSKITVQKIDLSLFNLQSAFRDSFSAADGFIKFYGNVVNQSQKQTICSIKLSKNNGRVYFCKGYKSALQAQKNLKPQTQKKVQFWVPMFNKKLYGRFKNYKSTSNEVCYANWDISISWEDEMQGALRYNKKLGVSFEQCTFYICIELQGTLLYSFEVNQDDYIL